MAVAQKEPKAESQITVGEQIKAALVDYIASFIKEKNWSGRAVSRRTGVHYTRISFIMTGNAQSFKIEALINIAEKLGCPIEFSIADVFTLNIAKP